MRDGQDFKGVEYSFPTIAVVGVHGQALLGNCNVWRMRCACICLLFQLVTQYSTRRAFASHIFCFIIAASHAVHYPPCIRVMVQSSTCLNVGDLYVITCTGASVGRENGLGHAILIPDPSVNKVDNSYQIMMPLYGINHILFGNNCGQLHTHARLLAHPASPDIEWYY